jgi:phosphoribosylglycinamide formyltransferase-1
MTSDYKLKIGFFASGGGSNMQAVIDACKDGRLSMQPSVVITNSSKIKAVERAKNENIPHYHISDYTHNNPEDRDSAILKALKDNGTDIIILAGYMKKISPAILKEYGGRILNIHPALLPKFGGEHMHGDNVHKAVIEAGETESGPTVHEVDEFYDNGKILMQTRVPVLEGDTYKELAARVLMFEYPTMIATLQAISTEKIQLSGLQLK